MHGRAACRLARAATFFPLLGGAVLAPLQAQTSPGAVRPPTAEEVRRPADSARPPPQSRLSVEDGIERTPCALENEAYRNIRFTPRTVAFDGLAGIPAEALANAWQPYVGREQPIGVVCEIRDKAATILRDAGYVAAVEIPEQKIADGNIRLRVLTGRIVAIRVRGQAGRAERLIASYLERLKAQPLFNRFDAERYLLLARDLPGYDIRLTLRSAETAPGELIGDVTVVHRVADVDFNIQDFGSRALGRWGGLARAQIYGITGLGDRTSLAFFTTSDFDEQQTVQVGHEMRLGSEGLTLGGTFTYSWAHPDVNDPALDIRARTLLATAEASYPFRRTLAQTLRGVAGLDFVDQDVRINGLKLSRDRLRIAFARLDFEQVDPDSFGRRPPYSASEPRWRVTGSVELRQGLSILGATDRCGANFARCILPGVVPPSRLEGDPTATVLRMQALGEFRPVPKFTVALGVRGQYSGDPLLSFEEYSAGNYTVGRGYDPGALLGDRGFGAQAELRYGSLVAPNPRAIMVQPYVFLDAAWVRNEDRLRASGERQRLASLGGGARAAFGDRAFVDAVLAVPLDRAGVQARRGDVRFLVSLTTRFSPGSRR
jgi:hemolysin activation/secretion protein